MRSHYGTRHARMEALGTALMRIRRTARNGCPTVTIFMLGLALVLGARLRSGRLGRRPWRLVCRPLLRFVGAGSGLCGDRLLGFAGGCTWGFFWGGHRL